MIRQIVGEVAAVSAAMKVPLAPDMAEKVVKWTQEIRDIHTSMYDDWKAGRPTEIDYLNGYIVRKGRELGIPTPVNEALTAMVKVIRHRAGIGSRRRPYRGAVVRPVALDRTALRSFPRNIMWTMLADDAGDARPGDPGEGITWRSRPSRSRPTM